MDYGPAPESDSSVNDWLDHHNRRFGLFIDGTFTQPGETFTTVNPGNAKPIAEVTQATAADIDAAVAAARACVPGVGGAQRARARPVPLRDRPPPAKAEPPLRGARDDGQRQAHPRDPGHRHPARGTALQPPRRVGAGHGHRAPWLRAAWRRGSDHPVELPDADAGVEDRPGDRDGQHRGAETRRLDIPDRAGIRGGVPRHRPAARRRQHRHRRRSGGRGDRRAPGHRQDRVHRVDRCGPHDPRGDRGHRQEDLAGAGRQVAVRRVRQRRPGQRGRRRRGRDLVQPGAGVLRRLAPADPGEHRRDAAGQAARADGEAARRRPARQGHRHRRDHRARASWSRSKTWSSRASTRARRCGSHRGPARRRGTSIRRRC